MAWLARGERHGRGGGPSSALHGSNDDEVPARRHSQRRLLCRIGGRHLLAPGHRGRPGFGPAEFQRRCDNDDDRSFGALAAARHRVPADGQDPGTERCLLGRAGERPGGPGLHVPENGLPGRRPRASDLRLCRRRHERARAHHQRRGELARAAGADLSPVSAPAAQAGGAAWYWATSTLYFVNQQVGFAYPDAMYGEEAPWPGALFRTTDGGKRWAPVAFRGGTPSGRLAFVDATHGFATGLSASAAGGLQRRGAARAVPEGRTRVPADCANGRRKSPRSDRWSGSPAMHRKV